MKYRYMHTIGGRPAYFDGKQIVFACRRVKRLVNSLTQIRREQDKSIEFRLSNGWDCNGWDLPFYDYVLVNVDDAK